MNHACDEPRPEPRAQQLIVTACSAADEDIEGRFGGIGSLFEYSRRAGTAQVLQQLALRIAATADRDEDAMWCAVVASGMLFATGRDWLDAALPLFASPDPWVRREGTKFLEQAITRDACDDDDLSIVEQFLRDTYRCGDPGPARLVELLLERQTARGLVIVARLEGATPERVAELEWAMHAIEESQWRCRHRRGACPWDEPAIEQLRSLARAPEWYARACAARLMRDDPSRHGNLWEALKSDPDPRVRLLTDYVDVAR
jgi:hypothetical protein